MSGVLLRRSQLVSSKGSVYHRVESPHIANSRISVETAPGHMSGSVGLPSCLMYFD